MFRFTIRDLLWLMVVVGMGVGWWIEHQWVTRRNLAERFEDKARTWEAWCDQNRRSSVLRFTEHQSVDALVEMGDKIVPMIFERWKPDDYMAGLPPWWKVLERITGMKMVSDAEKANGGFRPESVEIPSLETSRWRDWWEHKGKRQYGIQPSPSTVGVEI